MGKVVISGYYGFSNTGDEAILAAMIQALRKEKKDIELVVLSAKPAETAQQYGVETIGRYALLEIWQALKAADLLISGGGGLLQDVTSSRTIPYYLALLALAKMLGKKTFIYAQGIGPIQKRLGKCLTSFIGKKVDFVTVRDALSAKELLALGLNKEKIMVTADPVLALYPEGQGKDILEKAGVTWKKPLLGIALRDWKNSETYRQTVIEVAKLAQVAWDVQVVLLPFHLPEDYEFSLGVAEKIGGDTVLLSGPYLPAEYLSVVGLLDLVLGMRLHALIFAFRSAIPFVGISYDPKVTRFLQTAGNQPGLLLHQLTVPALWSLLEETWQKRDKIKLEMKKTGLLLEKRALSTAKQACCLLRK